MHFSAKLSQQNRGNHSRYATIAEETIIIKITRIK